jgi:hypothetical protein
MCLWQARSVGLDRSVTVLKVVVTICDAEEFSNEGDLPLKPAATATSTKNRWPTGKSPLAHFW